MANWHLWLSSISQRLSEPIIDLSGAIQIPLLSALLFGLIGSLAPCQLTANASAMAYVGSSLSGRRMWSWILASFLVGKVTAYSVFGASAVWIGAELGEHLFPVLEQARRIVGPALIIMGLMMLGVVRLRLRFGTEWAEHARRSGGLGSPLAAYFLGILLAFTFCPTLFWLFFGLTLPLAMGEPLGWALPAAFAFGTTLPLLAMGGVMAAGADAFTGRLRRMQGWSRRIRPLAGAVFLLAGIHDTWLHLVI